jgi:hypothetical protein
MAAWKQWLQSHPFEWQLRPTPAGVEEVRRRLLEVLEDCAGFDCDRLRWRVHMAECAQELWLLRDAVFQVVSSQHCQQQAMQRLDGLAPVFRKVLPAAALRGA